MKQTTSFINWKPILSPEEIFSDIVKLNEIKVSDGNIYWLEMRPAEKGRCVIVQRDKTGKFKDITPLKFNVRTRVHEYGGGAYAVFKNNIYFVNYLDQRIYRQSVDSAQSGRVTPLTPLKNKDGSLGKYASLTVSPDGKKLLFVYEKEYQDKENENFLAVLELDSKGISQPKIIVKGSNFYADPVFSKTGNKIAWLQWNYPYMPWDRTELMVADFKNDIIYKLKKVAGGDNISICLPKFNRENKLYFVMDKEIKDTSSDKNWWNIYFYANNKIEQVTFEQAEFGEPHWVFGQSSYDFLPNGRIIARMVKDGKDSLALINPKKKLLSLVKSRLSSFDSITTNGGAEVLFVGANSARPRAVYSLNLNSNKTRILKKSSDVKIAKKDISLPKFITYPTLDRNQAHAFLYLPKNSNYLAPKNEKPPLLVLSHGGPTARTEGIFSFIIQFWTSSGFAVIDVDYRGSVGYGRKYRDELLSNWGLIDAQDVADAVSYLIKEKKVDASRVAVRGGSAGGYMVQRVMTRYPDLFKAGASYYGIGDLTTLAKQTHKFESRYIDNLIGAKLPEGEKEYRERSPINYLDKLKAPMIIFQGSDDKIVTPDCSREVAAILKKRGIKYEYVEYEGETHGFKMKKNNVDSLKREFRFYREIFAK